MRRIGIEIGGTFTDIVYLDDDAMVMIADKVPTTPTDLAQAVLAAVHKIEVDMADVELLVYGTTAGLNVVMQKTGARAGLTVGNASTLDSALADCFEQVRHGLAVLHFSGQLRVVAGGGVPTVDLIEHKSSAGLASRSCGGVYAAAHVAEALGLANVVVMDVGGTSSDISLIGGGRLRQSSPDNWPESPALLAAQTDGHCLGYDGGSIARLDAGGRLIVGPESAGADPGPICYGRGGTEPTVTDAAVINGLIDPACFLGGEMELNKALAVEGMQRLAGRLGLDVHAAAEAVLNTACDGMAAALREFLVSQGCEPNTFALLACGGAGGLFAASLTRSLALQSLIIPPHPGVYGAYGLLGMDVEHELARPYDGPLQSADLAGLAKLYDTLEQEGGRRLALEGFNGEAIHFRRVLEMRCDGLDGCVAVEVPAGSLNEEGRRRITAIFAEQGQALYGRPCKAEPRITAVRLSAIGNVEDVPLEPSPPSSVNIPPDAFKHSRMVYFGGRLQEWVVLDRAYLLPANSLIGPLIVEERQHTTVVLPGQHFMVDAYSNLLIQNP